VRVFIIACSVGIALLAGCSDKKAVTVKRQPVRTTLVIGLIPEQNIFRQMERYEPLAIYLQSRTGYKINLVVLPRYGNIIDNFVSKGMDGAFFGSFTYTLAHAKLGVEVIARPETTEGISTYYGLIFVRKDSGIRTAADMRGKRFAFVDKATTAGYLLPLDYFHKNGIKDVQSYFKETYFAGTHEDAIYDVLNRKADIGAAKNTIFEMLAKSDGKIAESLVILQRSPEVPENSLALRRDISDEVKGRLREALLNMNNDPDGKTVLAAFGAQRFIPTTDDDFEPIHRYTKEIHLDLSSYDYTN
jgi:phosphonate transport system substrate-binding protein